MDPTFRGIKTNKREFLPTTEVQTQAHKRALQQSCYFCTRTKVKQSHYGLGQALRVPSGGGSQTSRQSAHEDGKVVRPKHGRLYPQGNIPGTHFCLRLSQPQGHSAAGRIMLVKNSMNTAGNRTRDLSGFSAVPQPNALRRAQGQDLGKLIDANKFSADICHCRFDES